MQFYVMTRTHVWQFTLVHVSKCQSTISLIMSSYFPMTGFKATVCVSTGDNRHNCAPTRWEKSLDGPGREHAQEDEESERKNNVTQLPRINCKTWTEIQQRRYQPVDILNFVNCLFCKLHYLVYLYLYLDLTCLLVSHWTSLVAREGLPPLQKLTFLSYQSILG